MIKNITIGQYFPGDSPVHRADPRLKIVCSFLYMVIVFIGNTPISLILAALFTAFILITAKIPFKYTLRGLKPILFLLLFTTVINVFFSREGTSIFNYGIINITSEGIQRAVKTAVRITLLIISASVLTFTTTPIMLTEGIEKLLAPLKKIGFPAHEIAMMMTIALRFIPTLMDETDKIIKAQSSRGADFDTGGLIAKAKSFIPILVPLFVSAFRRADDLAVAMEARCYRGSEGRTRMNALKFARLDLYIAVMFTVICSLIIVFNYI